MPGVHARLFDRDLDHCLLNEVAALIHLSLSSQDHCVFRLGDDFLASFRDRNFITNFHMLRTSDIVLDLYFCGTDTAFLVNRIIVHELQQGKGFAQD